MRPSGLIPAPSRGGYDRSLTRPERDAQHRERLLLATAEVLAEGAPTVSKIVGRAGVGRSTFYEFFSSPEHILEQLEQRTLRRLEGALDAALASSRTPIERLRSVARGWFAEVDARPNEARMVLTRRAPAELLSPAAKSLARVLERCVAEAKSTGTALFRAADEVALLAACAAAESVTRRHLNGPPLGDPARLLAELWLKLLR
jgi:AcrR family transcriptional regulator